MQKNKILAVYPDLCDHSYISDAFADSANEVVCVTCIIEAVKCLIEYTFIMVLVDSKMVANGNDSITTTLKTLTDVPILIVNAVIYKKTPHPVEHHPHHGHAYLGKVIELAAHNLGISPQEFVDEAFEDDGSDPERQLKLITAILEAKNELTDSEE